MSEDVNVECAAMLGRISAYLDGDLDAVECQAIDRHCRGCSRCTAVVEGLRETIGLCREAASAPLPEAVRQRAKASIQQLLAAEKPSRA